LNTLPGLSVKLSKGLDKPEKLAPKGKN